MRQVKFNLFSYFTARVVGVLSDREVIDPKLDKADRPQGNKSVPFFLTDVGMSLNLTGFKSWHGLVPVIGGGAGIGSSFEKLDVVFLAFLSFALIVEALR